MRTEIVYDSDLSPWSIGIEIEVSNTFDGVICFRSAMFALRVFRHASEDLSAILIIANFVYEVHSNKKSLLRLVRIILGKFCINRFIEDIMELWIVCSLASHEKLRYIHTGNLDGKLECWNDIRHKYYPLGWLKILGYLISHTFMRPNALTTALASSIGKDKYAFSHHSRVYLISHTSHVEE